MKNHESKCKLDPQEIKVIKPDTLAKSVAMVLLVVFVIFLMTLAAEGLMRYRQSQKMGGMFVIENLYQTDPVLKLRIPTPGLNTETIHIDSHGFRNSELVMPKPDNLVRIAFLGASTTFCAEVSSDEKTWPHITTQLNREKFPQHTFDYINAGVPGYGSDSTLRHLKLLVSEFQPDVIVIYQATNDLSFELRDLAREQNVYHKAHIDDKSWLAERSVLWDLVEKNVRVIAAQNNSKNRHDLLKFDADKIGFSYQHELTELVTAAKQIAPVVALVTFSVQMRPEQSDDQKLKAAASSLYYMPFMSPDDLIKAFDRYNDITRQVAQKNGVLLVEAANKIPGNEQNFNDSVHFKDAGSEKLANIIATVLSDSDEFRRLLAQKSG